MGSPSFSSLPNRRRSKSELRMEIKEGMPKISALNQLCNRGFFVNLIYSTVNIS